MDIRLRDAKQEDARLLFAWRNDGETRNQSRYMSPIEWERHEEWLTRALSSGTCHIVIAEDAEGAPLGTVRADVQEGDVAEISYTVAPLFRGKGLSKPIVKKFVDEYLKGKKIVAHIKRGHVQSESVARMLNLVPVREVPSEDSDDKRPMVEWR